MNDRLNAYLDGELALDQLTAEERAQAAHFDALVAEVRGAIDAQAPVDLDVRVMERIAALDPLAAPVRVSPLRRWTHALVDAREVRIRLRPVYGLAAAAALAGLLLVSPFQLARGGSSAAAVSDQATVYVQFRLQAESASSVALAGSFTGWQPEYSLHPSADGVWTVVLPIHPGVHDYVFVVDGERWVPDPYAPQVDDGFGGTNSRLTLLAPTTL
jgi:hypothetical protein